MLARYGWQNNVAYYWHAKVVHTLPHCYTFAAAHDQALYKNVHKTAGIVFEARDREGQLRAIAGGGRYDRLLETFGGDPQPCAGFGFGDAVITELLHDRQLLPELQHKVRLAHI